MTEQLENIRDKYSDNLKSFVSDYYEDKKGIEPSSLVDEPNSILFYEKDKWLARFVCEVTNFFYNSGYNYAMELNSLDFEKGEYHFGDSSFVEEAEKQEDENDNIFAPKLEDVSDEELINELKSRGYTGSLHVNKDINI